MARRGPPIPVEQINAELASAGYPPENLGVAPIPKGARSAPEFTTPPTQEEISQAESKYAPPTADEMMKATVKSTVAGMDDAQRADLRTSLQAQSPDARQRLAMGAFTSKVQNQFDTDQEARYLEYAAANATLPGATLAKARQMWIARPQYDLDYIVKNLPKVQAEVQAENIPWEIVANQHPVLAKYLQDPATVSQTLQDSAALTGISKWTGGNVTVLGEDGKPSEKFALPFWLAATKDAILNNTRAMFTKFGYAIFNADAQLTEALRGAGAPEALLNSPEAMEDVKKRWLDASIRYERAGSYNKDYRGFFDQDAAGFGRKLSRTAEWGVEVLAKNSEFLLGGALAKGTIGTRSFFTGYAALDIFPRASEASGSPLKAAALTALTAPTLGKVMEWTPAGTAIGARTESIIRNGVARAAADAMASHSWPSLARAIVLKGGWDALTGQIAFGVQDATNAAVEQLALKWGGKPTDDTAVPRAFYHGITNLDGLALSAFGTAHTLVADVGRLHRASSMATAIENLNLALTASRTAVDDPLLHEQQVKETVNQPGHDPFFFLPLDGFNEAVKKAGANLDPREVAKEIYGDYAAYDKAVAEGSSHISIPIEKMRAVFESKFLGDLAMNHGKLDMEVLTRAEAAKVSEEFQASIETAMSADPEKLSPEDKAIYDAALSFAGTDPAVAKEIYATVKALQARHPEFQLQQIWDATWGKGGLWGPPLEAANEPVPGMHKEAQDVEASRASSEPLIQMAERDSGMYNSKEWMQGLKNEQAKADLIQKENDARKAARERLETALKAGVRNQISYERTHMVERAKIEIQKDAGQRTRHFFHEGVLWGVDKNDPRLTMLTNPETGKPSKLLRSEVEALGFKAEDFGPRVITENPEKAMDVDMAANALGYKGSSVTGDPARKMLADLRNALPEGEFHRQWADAKLKSVYGNDLLENPQALLRTIMDGVQNEKVVPALLSRLRALTEQLDPVRRARSAMTAEQWEAFADRIIGDKSLRDLKPEHFVRAAKAASERALKALEAGQYGKAFDATEAQLLNHYLYRAARTIEGSMGAMYSKLSERATSEAWRHKLGKADPVYRELHDALLSALGIGAEMHREPGHDYVAAFVEQATKNGQADNIAADEPGGWDSGVVRSLTEGGREWRDLKPGEAREVFKAIQNIQHVAKTQTEQLKALEIADRKAVVADMTAHLARVKGIGAPPGEETLLQRALGPIAGTFGFDGPSVTAARLVLKYFGPTVYERVWPAFVKTRIRAHDLYVDIASKWQETQRVFEKMKGLDKPIEELEKLFPLPKGEEFTKAHLIQAAKWFGSASGREKLLKAFNVPPERFLEAFSRHLSPEIMEAIQAEHDFFDRELRPLKAEAWERRKGLPWEPVEALGYTVEFGQVKIKVKGGYFPIKWDTRAGVSKEFEGMKLDDPTGQNRIPTIFNASNLERTKYVGVPDLAWSNVPGHIKKDVHDIAFGDFILDTGKLLLDPKALEAIRINLGQSYANWPRAWLERVKMDGTGPVPPDVAKLVKAQLLLRRGFVTSILGGNWPLVAGDLMHPMTVASARYGPAMASKYVLPSMSKVMEGISTGIATGHDPIAAEIEAKSDIVRVRADTIQEQLSTWYTGTFVHSDNVPDQLSKWRRGVERAAFWHLHHSDRAVTRMIWDSVYRYTLDSGKGEMEARKAGDDAILATMPDYDAKSIPSLLAKQHDSIASAVLVFFSYRAKLLEMSQESRYDNLIDPNREAGRLEGYSKWAGNMAALITFGIVAGDFVQGRGKQENEDWWDYATRKFTVAPAKLLPYAGELLEPLVESKINGRRAPGQIIANPYFAPVERTVRSLTKALNDRTTDEDAFFAALDAALMVGRLPSTSPLRAIRYGYELASGEEQPRGAFDVIGGFGYGKKYGRSARYNESNPATLLQDFIEKGK